MKKTVLLLCLLSLVVSPVFAQKKVLKFLFGSRPKRIAVPTERVLRNVQGKKFLPGAKPALPAGSEDMERFVMRSVPMTDLSKIRLAFYPESKGQELRILMRYQIVLGERFAEYKKEMDAFLSYQLRSSSRRELSPDETRRIFERALEMEKELYRVGTMVSSSDPALVFAFDYVNRVKAEAAPILKGMSKGSPRFARLDRTFDGDEFWLHEPENKRWLSMLRHGDARRLAAKLPKNLRVAVLNDRESVLSRMQKSHEKGIFIQDGELDCFSRADDLLFSIRDLNRRYDLIITDIIVPGGGGYYIASELRLDGYDGAIIALSAFERDEEMGLDMFERGFDGMLNLPIGFEESAFWEGDVLRGLVHYYQLRDANGWTR